MYCLHVLRMWRSLRSDIVRGREWGHWGWHRDRSFVAIASPQTKHDLWPSTSANVNICACSCLSLCVCVRVCVCLLVNCRRAPNELHDLRITTEIESLIGFYFVEWRKETEERLINKPVARRISRQLDIFNFRCGGCPSAQTRTHTRTHGEHCKHESKDENCPRANWRRRCPLET